MNKEMDAIFGGGAVGVYGSTTNAGGGMLSSQMDRMFGCRSSGRALGPPGFLTKTFSLVDDPDTNSIVSWGSSGTSFIIWDHLQFSAQILPRFFKHSNLASFVYQLNSYGFRKIGVEHQWEYENPNFQAGKEYLLANMRRRVPRKRMTRDNTNADHNGVEIRAGEILRNKMDEYKLEIEKLKNKQAEMESRIMDLEEEVKKMENKSKKLTMFWNEIIMRLQTGRKEDDDETRKKKRKLDHLIIAHEDKKEEEIVKEDAIPLAENQQSVSSTDDCKRQIQGEDNNAKSEAKLNLGDYHFWRLLQEDNEACELSKSPTEMAEKIALDLEALIAKIDNDHEAQLTISL